MYFFGGLPTARSGYDYLYVVVDRFSKMVIWISCRKTVTGAGATKLLFFNVWNTSGCRALLFLIGLDVTKQLQS